MARRGGGGFGRSSSSSRSRSNTRTSARTAPPAPAKAQPQAGGGMFGGTGLMGTLMQGMAFGAGSEVAHQAIRGVMGGNSKSHEQQDNGQVQQMAPAQQQTNPCMESNNKFVEVF